MSQIVFTCCVRPSGQVRAACLKAALAVTALALPLAAWSAPADNAAQPGTVVAAASPPPAGAEAGQRQVVYTLRQLGVGGALTLRGTDGQRSVDFGVRSDEVVTGATLTLSGAMSPALLPEASSLTVSLNDQYVGTVPAARDRSGFSEDVPISPAVFQEANRLQLRFAGRLPGDCRDPLSPLLWTTVSDLSALTLTLQRLPQVRDLGQLPRPFFDRHVRDMLSLPFVLPDRPDDDTVRAAAIAASWFGGRAGYRGAAFPVLRTLPRTGDSVLVAGPGTTLPPGLAPLTGPTLAVLPNPTDALGSVLVIAGRTAAEVAQAAQVLAVGSRTLAGPSETVSAPDLPLRQPYDAPAWIAADRPIRLGELVDAQALQVAGYAGAVTVPFNAAPDLFGWQRSPATLDLRYHAPFDPVIDGSASRLDVGINGVYLRSLPLAPRSSAIGWLGRLWQSVTADGAGQEPESHVAMPAYDLAGSNTLRFLFDARPMHRAGCTDAPDDLQMGVDPGSTLDLGNPSHLARLPNLDWFAEAGFPFSRMADLSQSAVVVPDRPTDAELSALLGEMGRISRQTGLPVVQVAVVQPEELDRVADRDLLLVGTTGDLGPAAALMRDAPLRLRAGRLYVRLSTPLPPLPDAADESAAARPNADVALAVPAQAGEGLLASWQSPLHPGRSVVAMMGGSGDALGLVLRSMDDPQLAPSVRGDLVVMSDGGITPYRVGPSYTERQLPLWLWPWWALRNRGLLVAAAAAVVLLVIVGLAMLRRQALPVHTVSQARAAKRQSVHPR
jgi:cellulose synthase (UDP-forming)